MGFRRKHYFRLFKGITKYLIIFFLLFIVCIFYFQSLRSATVVEKQNVSVSTVGDKESPTVDGLEEDSSLIEKVYSGINDFISPSNEKGEGCKVTILDVGQASCAIVESNGEYMLFDGGDKSTSSYVVAYCKEQGIQRFKYIVASHYHADHVYGLIGVLESDIEVENIICPDYVADTSAQRALYERVPENERIIPYVSQKFQIGEITARCISPVTDSYSDDNGYSVGFVFEYGDFSFLIDGDATHETESDMLAEGIDVDVDMLVVPHHGSTYSSSIEWLEQVTPEVAVISCGKDNEYFHPHGGTLDRLKESGVKELYRTDLNGVVVVTSDGKSCSVKTGRDVSGKEWLAGGENTDTYSELWNAKDDKKEDYYIGNTASKKFHRPSCAQLPSEKRSTLFSTREEALKNNYVPCGNCNP